MSHAKPQTGWNASAFARCDVATLQQLYDVPSWTTAYSTCLDLPTTLTLSASTTSVSSPGSVTFTARLSSSGTGRLNGNPMSSRVVVLQVRSGTGWADLTTMAQSATAGAYTLRIAPKGTTDYRAVFRKPASEGVRNATSASVRVSWTCTSAPCPLVVSGAS